ncbi:MAG: FHA domain-containing protein [Actinomycetota bacterium]
MKAQSWQHSSLFGAGEGAFLPGVLFAGIVTTLLVVVDDLWTGSAGRILKRTVGIAGLAIVLGWGYSIIGHGVFAALSSFGGYGDLVARSISWALFGLGVGLCSGLASRSMRRAYQGCAGGLAGGFLGGALCSLLLSSGGAGSFNRLAGFTVLGAAVGLATALAEQLTRSAWVTLLSGAREGRQVVLHHDENVVGRDELADVPLFGDSSVAKRHAILIVTPTPAIREIGEPALLRVNGSPVREYALTDGDLVELGSHRFRFHTKDADALPELFMSTPPSQSGYYAAHPASLAGAARDASERPSAPLPWPEAPPLPEGGLILRVMAGPGEGRRVRLSGSTCTIGRELDNSLPLVDAKVSRYHAQITPVEGAWVLADLGSTNGTRLNGIHITRAGLAPGDFLYFGDTAVAVESAAAVGRASEPTVMPQATR